MRASNRFAQIRRRMEEIRQAALTPGVKRLAWAEYQASGRLPEDRDLRDLVERLGAAEQEFAAIHQPAPVAGQE